VRYRSTKSTDGFVSIASAVLKSLPPDRGLYVPETVPELSPAQWEALESASLSELAFTLARPFFEDGLSDEQLGDINDDAIGFDAPVVPVAEGLSVLELFHGPTLAFKDFGARFMARAMAHLRRASDGELTVLVATSGDTGAAVASGFFEVEGVRVFVLYPRGRVSDVQEQQLTTFGSNITAVEVDGTFDDCQRLVKQAFLDPDLERQVTLTSANSINIARLVPQMFYYARAWQQHPSGAPLIFSVPSGNLGNLTAGLLARAMGLPVDGFIAATNVNDAFVRYVDGRAVSEGPAHRTLSNAMDVGVPSNLDRIVWLFDDDHHQVAHVVRAYAFDDDATLEAIARVHRHHGYVLDPHTAVGWLAAERFRADRPGPPDEPVIVLATAHPAKFPDPVARALGEPVATPAALTAVMRREKRAIPLDVDFEALCTLLRA